MKRSYKPAVLITGAAKRIGQVMALHLAATGYDIALHYHHSETDAARLADTIRRQGHQCELFRCNLADQSQVKQLISRVLRKFPTLEVLINNASIFEKSNLKTGDIETFNRHFDINFKAPYILISEYTRRCHNGHIINILDTNIAKNKITHTAYLLSKKSLHDLTLLAAVELAPHIRVNAIAPGLILPPAKAPKEYLDRLAKFVPLKRKGDPTAVTQALQFLLEHDYLNGQILYVDGGEHLT